jgi:ABC-2 type transport system ATP-binding protein
MSAPGPAILTQNLSKQFGARTVVDAVCLEVPAGEVFGFLGPNGAGKTTTIAMLLGLIRPDAGRAVVLGHDVGREPEAALQRVGALLEPAFYPYLSGRDNLRVLARASGLPDTRVNEVLAVVELSAAGRERFSRYSRGMRQRLGIAAALMGEPELLVIDEPTEGLDPAGQRHIHQLIRGLADEGRTVFFSSHTLSEVERVCDRVAILDQGRLVMEGRMAELLQGGRGLTVRVTAEVARAAELLRAVEGVKAVEQEGELLVVDTAAERAAELNALLNARGVEVAEIRARARHLEDLFLELTERAGRRGVPTPPGAGGRAA